MLPARRTGAALLGVLALTLSGCTGGAQPSASPSGSARASTPSPTSSATSSAGPDATAAPMPDPTGTVPGAVAPAAPGPGDPRAAVEITIAFAGWEPGSSSVEVSGFVPVVESDGTCRLVLTSGAREVAVERAATPDVSTTSCGWVTVPGTQLAPGTWSAVLSYTSGASVATSAPVPVEVP